jgi:hypothetical protein
MLHPDAAREIQKSELIPAVTSKQSSLGFEVTAGMRVCGAYVFGFPSQEGLYACIHPDLI